MSKKKTLLMVMALVLVCAISVIGTVAYLQADTKASPVVNTFIYSGGDGPFVKTLELKEHAAVLDQNTGVYTLGDTEVSENQYKIVPGTTVPKDPFIRITGKDAAPAYLYVEVVSTTDSVFTWAIDATNWNLLDGVTGAMGGAVYVYKTTVASQETMTVEILEDNKVTVADTAGITELDASLTFYAYLAQATIGNQSDAAAVYTTCFPYTAPQG